MGINLIIYEDNDDLRSSMQLLLQWSPDYETITAFSNATTVIEDITTLKPAVVIMDIDMPECNGIEALKKIRSSNLEIPVIMFTVFEDEENIYNAICAGANGYLLKKNFDQVSHAVADVLAGGAPMTSSVAKKVLQKMASVNATSSKAHLLESLSIRENEILQYIVKGYSYKLIAAELDIATDTVRTHIKKIYKKLQVNSATAAVQQYHQQKK